MTFQMTDFHLGHFLDATIIHTGHVWREYLFIFLIFKFILMWYCCFTFPSWGYQARVRWNRIKLSKCRNEELSPFCCQYTTWPMKTWACIPSVSLTRWITGERSFRGVSLSVSADGSVCFISPAYNGVHIRQSMWGMHCCFFFTLIQWTITVITKCICLEKKLYTHSKTLMQHFFVSLSISL